MGLAVALLSIAIGVAGLAVGFVAYLRPRVRVRLAYQMASVRYFDSEDQALPVGAAMTFEGEPIQRLAKATIVAWNAGNEVLRGEDIVEPFGVSVEGGRLLGHHLVRVTDDAAGIHVVGSAPGHNRVDLRYDYLNPSDGLVVELVHDGTGSVEVKGKAKGFGGPESWGMVLSRESMMGRWRWYMPVVIVSLFVFALSARIFTEGGWEYLPMIGSSWLAFAVGLCTPIVGRRWQGRRRYPRALDPLRSEQGQ